MTARQLPFDLGGRSRLGRADFLPAPSNAAGLTAIDGWQGWPERRMLLTGPAGAGRTHLAAIWAAQTGAAWLAAEALHDPPAPAPAYALDDAHRLAGDRASEEGLFHLMNRARAEGAALLLTAHETPGAWRLGLADLESRLLACAATRIERPDDALLQMVLVKLFDDRQLAVRPETVTYLCRRIDRSLSAAERVVDALDRAALSRHKPVSRALAAEVLAARQR